MMKIGVFVGFQSLETLEQKFATLRENGFDNCQLSCWTMEVINEENAIQVKALAERYGITISAVWAGWTGHMVWDFYEGPKTLGIVPEDMRELRIPQLKNASDFAKVLGVDDVITHMGFIPEDPNDPIFPGFATLFATLPFTARLTVKTFFLKPVRKPPLLCSAALKKSVQVTFT